MIGFARGAAITIGRHAAFATRRTPRVDKCETGRSTQCAEIGTASAGTSTSIGARCAIVIVAAAQWQTDSCPLVEVPQLAGHGVSQVRGKSQVRGVMESPLSWQFNAAARQTVESASPSKTFHCDYLRGIASIWD